MRILYFGIPLGALALAEVGHPPVAAMIGPLDLPGRRRLRRRLPKTLLLGLPDLADASIQRVLRSIGPERTLSFFWPKRIPEAVLSWAPALGTHPSLLPRWRGPDPYFWAIREGDERSGVTLHRLEAQYDTGNIVDVEEASIEPSDDAWSLARKLDRPALRLLLSAADRSDIEGRAQEESRAHHAPRPTLEDLTIDWTRPAEEVERLIRASAPFGASADLGDHVVAIRKARVVPRGPALEPTEAWRSDAGWAVQCGRDALLLEHVEHEGVRVDVERLFTR